MDQRKCPQCAKSKGVANGEGVLKPSPGKLDQSGDEYLPTTVWTCNTPYCAYKEWDAAPAGTKPLPYFPSK